MTGTSWVATICLVLIKCLMITALLSVGYVAFAIRHSEIAIKRIKAILVVGHTREELNQGQE